MKTWNIFLFQRKLEIYFCSSERLYILPWSKNCRDTPMFVLQNLTDDDQSTQPVVVLPHDREIALGSGQGIRCRVWTLYPYRSSYLARVSKTLVQNWQHPSAPLLAVWCRSKFELNFRYQLCCMKILVKHQDDFQTKWNHPVVAACCTVNLLLSDIEPISLGFMIWVKITGKLKHAKLIEVSCCEYCSRDKINWFRDLTKMDVTGARSSSLSTLPSWLKFLFLDLWRQFSIQFCGLWRH